MANITIPVGTQVIVKTSERPLSRQAGEALGMIVPIYRKASDGKYYKADADPADTEKNTVVGITITISEADKYVAYVANEGTIIDFGVALTKGTTYWLTGLGTVGEYSDVTNGDALVQLGHCDNNQDFLLDILHYGQTKSA